MGNITEVPGIPYFQHAAAIQVCIAELIPPIKLWMYNSPSLKLKVAGYTII